MRIDRAGIPFIVTPLVISLIISILGYIEVAIVAILLSGLFSFFFRDPYRRIPDRNGVVVSPADGRVVHAGIAEKGASPSGAWLQVSIFLSPLDVHVNRVPVAGKVTRVIYQPGRFLPAYRPEAAIQNERCEVWIENNGSLIVCRQVVGLLARRVVCRLKPGSEVSLGQRFGVMKFGSRMDVFMPVTSALEISVGETVRGGETILATLQESSKLSNS